MTTLSEKSKPKRPKRNLTEEILLAGIVIYCGTDPINRHRSDALLKAINSLIRKGFLKKEPAHRIQKFQSGRFGVTWPSGGEIEKTRKGYAESICNPIEIVCAVDGLVDEIKPKMILKGELCGKKIQIKVTTVTKNKIKDEDGHTYMFRIEEGGKRLVVYKKFGIKERKQFEQRLSKEIHHNPNNPNNLKGLEDLLLQNNKCRRYTLTQKGFKEQEKLVQDIIMNLNKNINLYRKCSQDWQVKILCASLLFEWENYKLRIIDGNKLLLTFSNISQDELKKRKELEGVLSEHVRKSVIMEIDS